MFRQLSLNEEESEVLEFIRNSDVNFLSKEKDINGVPYLQHIFRLHLKLFGETCQGCPGRIPGYIRKIQQFKIQKNMSQTEKNPEYRLKKGSLITIPGTSDAYTEHNITDEIALELLIENPNRKVLFKVLPEDIEERIAKGVPDKDEDANLVAIGSHKFEFDKAKTIFDKAGIKSNASTVKGLNKKVAALSADESKILVEAANASIASINVNSSGANGKPEADNAGKAESESAEKGNQGNESGTSEDGK